MQHFSPADFETWALGDQGSAKATVYYNTGRLRSMRRNGLDVEAFLDSPAAARRIGEAYIAKLRLDEETPDMIRTYQKVLNWLCLYGGRLHPDERHLWKAAKFQLDPEPSRIPKTIELDRVERLWTEWVGENEYETRLGRAVAYTAYVGNFRRGELDRMRLRHLLPNTAQINMPRAGKRSRSGLVEIPWTAYHAGSPLILYLEVRVESPDGEDWHWTIPWTRGKPRPRRLRGWALYQLVVRMGEDLGVSVNFIRSKRRALSDIDERNVDVRVTNAKARHAEIDMTVHYLSQVSSTRQRRELAEKGVPGYEPSLARGVVRDLPARGFHAFEAVGLSSVGVGHGEQALGGDLLDLAQVPLVLRPLQNERNSQGGLGELQKPGAHAPQCDQDQQEWQNGDEDDEQPRAGEHGLDGSHDARRNPRLFPVSPSPQLVGSSPAAPGAPGGRRGGQVAVAGAVDHPAGLTKQPGLSHPMPGAARTAHWHEEPSARTAGFSPQSHEVIDMHAPTYVLKDGHLAQPVAVVQPRALRGTVSTPSPRAEWRPETGARTPASELPAQQIPRRIGAPTRSRGPEGTFTASPVVAPSGASPAPTTSPHPLRMRPARRDEVMAAAHGGR